MSLARTVRQGAIRLTMGEEAASAVSDWDGRVDQIWHRSSSALASIWLARWMGWPLWQQVVVMAIGWMFGGGRLSPDMDNCLWWRRMDRVLPDWVIGSPLRHHGATHSITTFAAVAAAGWHWEPAWWPLWWVAVAWALHGLGDALIGKGWHGEPGPCWLLWWGNAGLGVFKSGGVVCRLATVGCWVGTWWTLARA